ncbi:NEL-type E3 ubiquitin ligase domain-containing protein [Pseudomonas sp. DWP1b1]|uniref:NEL-type E3 ubiquitin ligase domain-containing protein n=1 Tax=unclassified Pseudomonas TaxID=196821 RepID=UPI003CF78259
MPDETPASLSPDVSHEWLEQKIPPWLVHTSPATRQAFGDVSTDAIGWLDSLTGGERRMLQAYNDASAHSHNALDQAMAGLQTVEAFARPLLAAAVKQQFALEPDLDATYVDLRNPIELGALGIRIGSFSVLSLSLLQAALHNFEDSECRPGAFASSSRFKRGPGEGGTTLDLSMSIAGFLGLCRTLDVGAKYQAYLKQFLQSASGLREIVIKAQKDALQAAAYQALLKGDIGVGDYAVIRGVIADRREIRDGGKPVWFNDISLMGLRLSGCTAFVAVEKHQSAQGVLVYIPNDPEHPLKKYASHDELQAELTRQLMAGSLQAPAGSGPSRYQRFLANYVAYSDQPTYWRRLTQEAADQPRDPFMALRVSQYVLPFASPLLSVLVGPDQLPAPKTVREPIHDPDFYVQVIAKRERWQENVELWGDNFDKLRDKLIADARGHAVPTAEVDAQARARKIAALENAGLLALNLVSMFVPGLGEVMMGVMAAQLLYETFEGVVEWHQGDREAALEHLTDVAENLAFVGVMAAGGAGLRKVLSPPPAIAGLKPVALPSGAQKLWKPDLAPYKVPAPLAAQATPDALGLYAHDGRVVLPLEGDHFEVRHDPETGDYRIQHPTRPHAYAPRLEHNHEGAWQHELDEPLTWDDTTTLRRLGQPVEGLSPERVRQAHEACGIEADALRAGHVDHEPIPLALADTLQRFRLAEELADFITRMKSAEPTLYAKADPALQMDLLRRRGMLPDTPLEVFEYAGQSLWRDPAPAGQPRRAVVLPEGALARGELLEVLLENLQDDDPPLREFPGQPTDPLPERARLLRLDLGEQAQAIEGDLLEGRYRAWNASLDPDVTRMQAQYPGLPSAMAEQLLRNLGEDQLSGFRRDGQLPQSVKEQAQWQQQELRLTRAHEGLFIESLANADTRRLQALAQHSPLSREAARAHLLEHPLRKPAYDTSMRLLGGGRGIRQLANTAANVFRAPTERVRRLFPTFNDAEVASFIASLGSDVRSGLFRLENEYASLKGDLKAWVRANASPLSDTAFERRGGFARAYADAIKRCWRRETNTLKIDPGQPLNLPRLTADFSHVQELQLNNVEWDADANAFLNNFKQLQHLRIKAAALSELPLALGDMGNLTHLQLRANQIRLTAQSVQALGGLSRLQRLDLAQNPLGLAPDFTGMPHLRYVDLSRSGLEQWPTGLREQADLQELNLRDNLLRAIPADHLEPLPEDAEKIIRINQVTSLMGNPLSAEAEQALDNYWRRLSVTHPRLLVDGRGDRFSVMSPAITQMFQMFPNYDIGQCRQYIWSLGPGASIELARMSREFVGLNAQLDAWVFSGGGARQRYVRAAQVLENFAGRDDRVLARSRILACWRKETPQRRAADGTLFGQELDLSDLALPTLPDLDADLDHVGSLKLAGMHLNTSPEGFLERFRGLRWLDMSNNQLRELPPALGEMHGLTRLFLDNNQIRLTPDTARILSERTTLRALWMDRNPLGSVPDFSLIPDLRSVHLNGTGIEHWPVGLGPQALLDDIDLSNNQLTTLPDYIIAPSDQQRLRSVRLSSIMRVDNNPFSETTLQQVRAYSARLQADGLLHDHQPPRLVSTALGLRSPVATRVLGTPFERWARGFSPEQVVDRTRQWQTLRDWPGSDGFFQMLADLDIPDAARDDLQQRVWAVIDSITEPGAESEALREEMFTWAGRAACSDRAALSFSNVEIMRLVYRAKALATEAEQGRELLTLARGLFRLDEVEKTALSDIAARTDLINNAPDLSQQARLARIEQLEEVEIRLAYRHGLKGKQQLDLPGQPDRVRFTSLGKVSQAVLDDTCTRIRALNNSPQELQALLSRDFWKDYVTRRYQPQFEALQKPCQEQVAALWEQFEAGQLPRQRYEAQARALQDQLAIAEAELIERLTRTEQEAHPLPGPPAG